MVQQTSTKISFSSTLIEIVESDLFVKIITSLIILNAAILGMETYPYMRENYGEILKTTDHIILWMFVIELSLRFLAYKKDFFKNPWTLFDLFVVAIAFIPTNEVFSVLRAIRVLRVLRLVSIFPRLRRVAEGLIRAIPGIGSIGAVMTIVIYVFGVMATKLYGSEFPDWFGTLQASIFSLFQIMTLEGWPDIVRTVMKTNPQAWLFFVTYILIATFSVLNLFIAVIVDAMQKQQDDNEQENQDRLAKLEEKLDRIYLSLNKSTNS